MSDFLAFLWSDWRALALAAVLVGIFCTAAVGAARGAK